MRIEKTIDLGSTAVRVREITVGQMRNLLALEDLSLDVMGFLSGKQEIPTELLNLFTDLKPERLESLTFSELSQVIVGVREVNAGFFEVLEALGLAQGLLAGLREKPSTKPSSS